VDGQNTHTHKAIQRKEKKEKSDLAGGRKEDRKEREKKKRREKSREVSLSGRADKERKI